MSRALTLCIVGLSLGCGSSSAPPPPASEVVTPAPVSPPPPVVARRTMTTVGLFGGTSMDNLILDPTFEDGGPGIGRWIARTSDGSELAFSQRVTAGAPQGAGLPVGVFEDAHAFTLLAQVVGGVGPYVGRLWVTTDSGGDEAALGLVKVSLAGAGAGGLLSTDLPRVPEATRVLGGRTWWLFEGEAKGPFALGGFLIVRVRASKQRFLLQAPVVLPRALTGAAKLSADVAPWPLARTALPRALEPDEAAAIEHVRRVPLVYGAAPSVKKYWTTP